MKKFITSFLLIAGVFWDVEIKKRPKVTLASQSLVMLR